MKERAAREAGRGSRPVVLVLPAKKGLGFLLASAAQVWLRKGNMTSGSRVRQCVS